jgi:hypothetical protein
MTWQWLAGTEKFVADPWLYIIPCIDKNKLLFWQAAYLHYLYVTLQTGRTNDWKCVLSGSTHLAIILMRRQIHTLKRLNNPCTGLDKLPIFQEVEAP